MVPGVSVVTGICFQDHHGMGRVFTGGTDCSGCVTVYDKLPVGKGGFGESCGETEDGIRGGDVLNGRLPQRYNRLRLYIASQ